MPQLWRSNSASNGRTSGNAASTNGHHRPANKSFSALMMCTPLGPTSGLVGSPPPPPLPPAHQMSDAGGSAHPAANQPSSPTHPKHYDQLLNELRLAQERRGRLLDSRAALSETSGAISPPPLPHPDSKSPPPPLLPLGMTLKQSEQPSGHLVNPFLRPLGQQRANLSHPSSLSTPLSTKSVPKRVRFLEDGTGNLHTSVFGGSAESLGSLLDSSEDTNNQSRHHNYDEDDIDSLISSLTNFDPGRLGGEASNGSTENWPRFLNGGEDHFSQNNHQGAAPASISPSESSASARLFMELLRSKSINQLKNGDPISPAVDKVEVVDQRQTVVHLEPDDPNSVDSGSVLSELDFEETSSTITETYSVVNSPDPVHRDDSNKNDDLFAEVSDLLEQSLQEIRRMEEDSTSKHDTVLMNTSSSSGGSPDSGCNKSSSSSSTTGGAIREPLYELIGWKRRNSPPVQLDLRGAKPYPLPSGVATETSPTTPTTPPAQTNTDIWVPRTDFVPPTESSKKTGAPPQFRNGITKGRLMDDMNPIYGRLWEAASSSAGESSRSSTTSSNSTTTSGDDLLLSLNVTTNNNSRPSNGGHPLMSGPNQIIPDQELSAIRSMARKARLEHWKLTGIPSSNNSPTTPEPPPRHNKLNGGIQLTWPPPPPPQSSCSSSATTTPATPTLPSLPCLEDSQHSPKCFGHQRTFQWPIPATETGPKTPRSIGQLRRPSLATMKPGNLEAAQDWYWTQEFPKAAGLEPGTGHMSVWFHGAISRAEAERRLAERPTGAFLVRLTERLWGYALSVRNPAGGFSHFLIDAGTARNHQKYTLLGSSDPSQKSLRELIQFYGKNPLTPEGKEKLLFPCPQEAAVSCNSSSTSR